VTRKVRRGKSGAELIGSIWIRLPPWKSTQWFYLTRRSAGRYELVCFCDAKRDGENHCAHSRKLWPLLRPWYRARMTMVMP